VKEAKGKARWAIDLLEDCKEDMRKYMAEDVTRNCELLESLRKRDRIVAKDFEERNKMMHKAEARWREDSNWVAFLISKMK
jgi:hypothetical protein